MRITLNLDGMMLLMRRFPKLGELSVFRTAQTLYHELRSDCCKETSRQKDAKHRFELLLNSLSKDQIQTIKNYTGATNVSWYVTDNNGRTDKRSL